MRITQKIKNRFLSKISKVDGCWVWQAGLMRKGYGQFSPTSKKNVRAHKFSYEMFKGRVPKGLQLDHLCRNRACVNPEHLEAVTARENLMRSSLAPAFINTLKTHCPKGHEYGGENLRIRASGSRDCHRCAIDESRRYKRKNRVELNRQRRLKRMEERNAKP